MNPTKPGRFGILPLKFGGKQQKAATNEIYVLELKSRTSRYPNQTSNTQRQKGDQ